MGWSVGSEVMIQVINGMKKRKVSKYNRKVIFEILIPAMQSNDWDTEIDLIGEDTAYDEVLVKMHPSWFE